MPIDPHGARFLLTELAWPDDPGMTPRAPADQLEARRRLAVTRVWEAGKHKDVAAFLSVSLKAVSERVAAHRVGGNEVLVSSPHPVASRNAR